MVGWCRYEVRGESEARKSGFDGAAVDLRYEYLVGIGFVFAQADDAPVVQLKRLIEQGLESQQRIAMTRHVG